MTADVHKDACGDHVGSHGVVAVGDSWLSAYGLPLGGVSCMSWAGWLAWGSAECLTQLAVNGATANQVARDQLPLLRHRQFRIGAVWLGANDLGHLEIDRFVAALTQVCSQLTTCCHVVAIATLPAAVRTPALSWRETQRVVTRANEGIRQAAREVGATVVEMESALTGRWAMDPNRQHPTSLGQLEAAHVAAASHGLLTGSRQLPDMTMIAVPEHQQRLYSLPARERVRGAIVDLRQRRAERDSVNRLQP